MSEHKFIRKECIGNGHFKRSIFMNMFQHSTIDTDTDSPLPLLPSSRSCTHTHTPTHTHAVHRCMTIAGFELHTFTGAILVLLLNFHRHNPQLQLGHHTFKPYPHRRSVTWVKPLGAQAHAEGYVYSVLCMHSVSFQTAPIQLCGYLFLIATCLVLSNIS